MKENNNTGESSNGRTPDFDSEDVGSNPASPSKVCTKCNQRKGLQEFAKKPKGRMGTSSDCKVCHRKVRNALYTGNENERVRVMADTERRRKIAKEYIANLKAKSQCKCGYKGVALQFHHLGDKDMEVSKAVSGGWSLERLKKEIAKCEIMCANCHMEEHF